MREGFDDETVDGLDAAESRRNVGNTAATAGDWGTTEIQSAAAGVCHETAKGHGGTDGDSGVQGREEIGDVVMCGGGERNKQCEKRRVSMLVRWFLFSTTLKRASLPWVEYENWPN